MVIGLILGGGSVVVAAAVAFIVRNHRRGVAGIEPTGFNNPPVSEDWWTEIPHAKPSETKEWYEGP